MPRFTMFTGVGLVFIGIVSYMATGGTSITALIPSMIGLVLFTLGALARKPERLKLMMHAAAVLALIGLLGTIQGIPAVFQMLSGAEIARPAAAMARAVTAILLLVYLVACINSFIQARKARKSAEGPASE